jgi:hypothetical protein
MRQLKWALRVFLAALVTLASRPATAAVPQRLNGLILQMSAMNSSNPEFIVRSGSGAELDLSYIRQLTEMARADLRMTVADVIPTNLKATDHEAKIARQIIGHSLERWFEQSAWARDNIGEALQALEAPLNTEVRMKSASGVAHTVKMHLKAARAIASVTYSGWVNATLAYQITSRTLGFEVSRAIAKNQKVIFTASTQPEESRQIVGYRYEF